MASYCVAVAAFIIIWTILFVPSLQQVGVYEGGTLGFGCPYSNKIRIKSAAYYKAGSKCCKSDVKAIAEKRCNGLTYCYLPAQNSIFGNPCGADDKRLDVDFGCYGS